MLPLAANRGGSNLVLTQDFEGLVMLMAMDQVFWPVGERETKHIKDV